MTYENRLITNYSFGTLTQAAGISDLTLTSADFATMLPSGLSTTTYAPITLQDPTNKYCEVVWSTAHAASATTATVVRGRESTTARAWPSGTLWTTAPTTRDGLLPVANRAALPTDPHVGLRCLLQDEQAVIERYLVSWAAPAAMLRQTTAQSIPNMTTQAVVFQAEDVDNAGGHDPVTNPSYYTIRQAGRYQLAGTVNFAPNATGIRVAQWQKNGVPISSGHSSIMPVPGTPPTQLAARTLTASFAVNDYVQLIAYHEAGVALSTGVTYAQEQSHMSVQYVGP